MEDGEMIFALIIIAAVIAFVIWLAKRPEERGAQPDFEEVVKEAKKHQASRPEPSEEELKSRAASIAYYEKKNTRNQELVYALSSRVLSDSEMAEVLQHGKNILLHWQAYGNGANSQCYKSSELEAQFSELLQAQGRLRLYAESIKPKKTAAKRKPKKTAKK